MRCLVQLPAGRCYWQEWSVADGASVSGMDIKSRVASECGIPAQEQVLLVNQRHLASNAVLVAAHRQLLVVEVLLALSGGKGGFGSLLRGGPAGSMQKKTTDFGAWCGGRVGACPGGFR